MFRTTHISSRLGVREQVEAIRQAELDALARDREDEAQAQAEAEQTRQEYREARMLAIRPVVAEFVKNERPDLDFEANIGLICAWLVDHNYKTTDTSIRVAIVHAGVSPKPPLSGQELRDDLERQIMALLVASPAERERERQTYHARMAVSRDETFSKRHTGGYIVSTASMVQRLVNLQESARLRALSHSELQAEVRASTQAHGFEPLPETFTAWQISSMSGADWQQALRKYGVAQLNQRISEQQARGEWQHVPIVGGDK